MSNFWHFSEIFKVSQFLEFYLGTILKLLWKIFTAIGQIFNVVNGQILSKYCSNLVTLMGSSN